MYERDSRTSKEKGGQKDGQLNPYIGPKVIPGGQSFTIRGLSVSSKIHRLSEECPIFLIRF
jgi:hypothetical protein